MSTDPTTPRKDTVITVTDLDPRWTCDAGASLIAQATSPGAGRLPRLHAVIYVCAAHQTDAEALITAAGYALDTEAAPAGHRRDPWTCGHITAYEAAAAAALSRDLAEQVTTTAAAHRAVTHYSRTAGTTAGQDGAEIRPGAACTDEDDNAETEVTLAYHHPDREEWHGPVVYRRMVRVADLPQILLAIDDAEA